jgi:hypothetical protein
VAVAITVVVAAGVGEEQPTVAAKTTNIKAARTRTPRCIVMSRVWPRPTPKCCCATGWRFGAASGYLMADEHLGELQPGTSKAVPHRTIRALRRPGRGVIQGPSDVPTTQWRCRRQRETRPVRHIAHPTIGWHDPQAAWPLSGIAPRSAGAAETHLEGHSWICSEPFAVECGGSRWWVARDVGAPWTRPRCGAIVGS